MRHTKATLTALCVGSMIMAMSCNSNDNKLTNTGAKGQLRSSDWTLLFKSKCAESVAVEDCVGAYGFAVHKNGAFDVGPGPEGAVRHGNIAAEDLAALNAALAINHSAEKREKVEDIQSEDTLSFDSGNGGAEILVATANSELVYHTASLEEAKGLLAAVKNLAQKYYSLPFPDTCSDSIAALQSTFDSYKSCNVDSDCGYVSTAYDIVSAYSGEFVFEDDCTKLAPMVAANAKSISENKGQLIEKLEQIKASCGEERFIKQDCTAYKGFYPEGAIPVCAAGKCQKNPSIIVAPTP